MKSSKYVKKIKLETVESFLGVDLNINKLSIGFDVAVHSTGIAIIKTTDTYLILEQTEKIITPHKIDQLSALDSFISQLDNFKNKAIQKYKINISIIEDCFMGKNVNTLKALARHSALVYDRLKRVSDKIELLLPNQARKRVNFQKSDKKIRGHALKKEIVNYVNNALNLDLKVKDNDIADAIILSLSGLVENK